MIRELFIADLARNLVAIEVRRANSRNADDGSPREVVVATPEAISKAGIMLIIDFSNRFIRVEFDENNNPMWPEGYSDKYSVFDMRYDALEHWTNVAMKYMLPGEYDPKLLYTAVRGVHNESLNIGKPDEVFMPPERTENTADVSEIGSWLAGRIVWYYQQSQRAAKLFAPQGRMTSVDVHNWLEATFVSVDDFDTTESVDHPESEEVGVLDVEAIMKQFSTRGLGPVELHTVSTYQLAGRRYLEYLHTCNNWEQCIDDECASVRESTRRWAKDQQIDTQSRLRADGYRIAS